jgi:hypothetical protein
MDIAKVLVRGYIHEVAIACAAEEIAWHARSWVGGATCVWSFGSVLWVTKWLLQRCLYLAPPMFEEQYQGNVSPLARSHHRSAPAFPRPRAPSPKHTGIDDRASGFSFCLSSDSHEQSQ